MTTSVNVSFYYNMYLINASHAIQENLELLGDGYHGDVIGESTPDLLVSEFV